MTNGLLVVVVSRAHNVMFAVKCEFMVVHSRNVSRFVNEQALIF